MINYKYNREKGILKVGFEGNINMHDMLVYTTMLEKHLKWYKVFKICENYLLCDIAFNNENIKLYSENYMTAISKYYPLYIAHIDKRAKLPSYLFMLRSYLKEDGIKIKSFRSAGDAYSWLLTPDHERNDPEV